MTYIIENAGYCAVLKTGLIQVNNPLLYNVSLKRFTLHAISCPATQQLKASQLPQCHLAFNTRVKMIVSR